MENNNIPSLTTLIGVYQANAESLHASLGPIKPYLQKHRLTIERLRILDFLSKEPIYLIDLRLKMQNQNLTSDTSHLEKRKFIKGLSFKKGKRFELTLTGQALIAKIEKECKREINGPFLLSSGAGLVGF